MYHRRLANLVVMLVLIGAVLVPSGVKIGAQEKFQDPAWRYQFQKPVPAWNSADFNDSHWREGPGGFGNPDTPGARVGTEWESESIWMRRWIQIDTIPTKAALLVHHDEDAQIYLNGQRLVELPGFTTKYQVIALNAQQSSLIKKGENLMAVHCQQTTGGQFIDVHLVDFDKIPNLPEPQRRVKPFQSSLITKWGKQLEPDRLWQEYPRPGLVRNNWLNLNGTWNYAIAPIAQSNFPKEWSGKIAVPFSLESRLSGAQILLHADQSLWYSKDFEWSSPKQKSDRTFLHFEAVDYRCQVWLNGSLAGEHQGGNTPFRLEITTAIKPGQNRLIVRVEDSTEKSQLRGKQTLSPRGIWYTQVSGIWQTVWIESVADRSFDDFKIKTDASDGKISIRAIVSGASHEGDSWRATVLDQGGVVAKSQSKSIQNGIDLIVPDAKRWSPEQPHLYDLKLELVGQNDQVIDEVTSYAGIRSVGKTRDKNGHLRFTLNGKEIFHWGPLDQGWWHDGLLTPPSDVAMVSDIQFLKDAGFNMIRKHIKVEPRRYYYHCDRLGMMVWQDQVSGGAQPKWTRLEPNPDDANWTDQDHQQFMREFEWMIDSLENHPSIVVWTPFNEAWAQHRTMEVGKWAVSRDSSRLINIASGGNFWPVGDIVDEHHYPHPTFPFKADRDRDYIKVVGEFGGHGLVVPGHIWNVGNRNWGYGGLPKNEQEYKERYVESIRLLAKLKSEGIAAGVYTQTTDVEGEVNGLITYDREVVKLPAAELKSIHQVLFE